MSVTTGVKRRRRRSTVVSSAVLAVVALVVTGFAVNYPGLTSSRVDVSNGGVWVTSESDRLMGRVNVDAGELDARLSMNGDDLDLLQSGYTVFETGPRGISSINTASIQRGGLVELPPDAEAKLGGDRVAIATRDGRVWILTPEEAAAFSPASVDPVHTAESGAPKVAVSTNGTVFVLDGTSLLKFPSTPDTRETKAEKPIPVENLSSQEDMLQLSTVGEKPVILDKENRLLRAGADMKEHSLEGQGSTSYESAQLQQPSPASDNFVVATEDTLFVVPFDGGTAQTISAGGTGEPTPPAQAKGCAYGAWNASLRYVRACEGSEPVEDAIPGAKTEADLTLRVNQDLVLLNDQNLGLSWEIAKNMDPVDDWPIEQDLEIDEAKEKEKETLTTTITNIAAERDEENRPPTANDDEFGVRPGASVVLPVTRNDTDPDGDILTVAVEGKQPSIGTVTPIRGGTQLQVAVDEDAKGSTTFTYEAQDGRGAADTATVTLDVREEAENSAPQPAQDAITKVQVRSGEDISFNLKPYWEDPDGDAFYLANATVDPDDVVTFQPDGLITFNDAGITTGTKTIEVSFVDEHGATEKRPIEVEAVTDSDLAPITTGDHASIVAGRESTIKPLVNDLNPNGGSLDLTNVSEVDELEVDAVLEAGTINVTGQEPGTYYLEYTVTASDSSTASLGIIRVDVVEPTSEELAPVAVDDLGTVTTGTDTLIDPLENDVDPTGGVLVVNSVEVPKDSGLKATIVAHHLVRVEAEPGAVVSDEPVALTYEVANSAGSTSGTIRVLLASTQTQFANPIAVPDREVVRAGDMVTMDVVSNDVSPTDSEMHLGDILESADADEEGHVEPHQDQVRFRADDDASGEATFTYQVIDETGRDAAARVTVTIIPRDASNAPPRPDNLTARTVAGTSVRIPVPTSGIDPDGDSVMLTGITTPAPQLGEIISANGEWIEYKPYDDSVGTDRFRYQVMDRHGAIGTGEVLVGVAEPHELNQAPYAVDDTVEVRPDREVQIPVLENDTDPEGATLSVVRDDVEATTEIDVAPQDKEQLNGVVTVTTPTEPGTHTVLYSASDGSLKSSAAITIKVDPDAPLRSPIARDDFVPAEEVMDPEAKYIDVDVLANDTDPDGSSADLEVTLDGSPDGARYQGDGIVRVTPQEEQQRLRYTIEDVDGQKSAGYIWIPGSAKQAPVWVGEPVEVQAGSEQDVDLSDPSNVRVRPGGQPATITDPTLVTAAHTDGSELVKGTSTLVYRPAEDFSGKDTISVEVTDGEADDATAATSTLAIPVEVTAKDSNLPPTLQGSVLEIAQGDGQGQVDLAATAKDPEGDELSFAVQDRPMPEGVEITLTGSELTASATPRTPTGTVLDVPVSASDGTNPPVTATVQLSVVASTKPLLSAMLDEREIDAGESDTIDVLENDSNPFPGGERTVTDAQLVSGKGTVVPDGNQVTITPNEDFHGILTAQYSVLDETGDPARMATGEIRVKVRGKPGAPSAPRIGEVGDGFVELNFTAGDDNGAPITGYEVTTAGGQADTQDCPSTSCIVSGLTNDTEYTFQVVAINDVGPSEPSAPSAVARPDVRPETPSAPSAQRGDSQLTVTWAAPVNHGSAIQRYDLQMQDTSTGQNLTQEVDASTTQYVWEGLTNGANYRYRIRAHNLADKPSGWSGWSQTEHPAGKPAAPSGTPTASRIKDPKGGGVTVTWPAMSKAEANGEPITQYIVASSSGESIPVDGKATTATFYDLDQDSEHTFTVTGVNSVGTGVGASAASNKVVPWARASAPTNVKASLPGEGQGDGPNGKATVSWTKAADNGTTIKEYVITWSGGGRDVVSASETSYQVSGLTNGTAYTFTVQATNRFEGGESNLSKASNSVTPYTKPDKPSVGISTAKCTGASACPMTFTAKASGSDGGAGGKTLVVLIDGKQQKVNGTSFSTTIDVKSASAHTVEAYVTNGKKLSSGTVAKDEKAQTYTPPTPTFDESSLTWGDYVPKGKSGCVSGDCRWLWFSVSNLEPGKTYDVRLTTPSDPDYLTVPVTADKNGHASIPKEKTFYGWQKDDYKDMPLAIYVGTTKVADDIYMP